MPDRKRRPATKRTAAKRTPAKRTPATKPAEPVEETVTEEGADTEVEGEGTPVAQQDAPSESVEVTGDAPIADAAVEAEVEPKAPAAAEQADEPSTEPDADVDADVEPDDRPDDDAGGEISVAEPDDPPAEAEAEVGAEPVDDPASGSEEPEVPDEPEEPAEPTEEAAEVTPHEDEKVTPDGEPVDEPDKEPDDDPAPLVGRARLFDALTHFRRGQVAVAVLLCLLGYAAVVQVQTNTEDSTYAGLREQELIDILSGLAGTTQKAQEQIEELEATREELEDQTLQQQTALQRAEEQVDTLKVIAGTVPVSGPGITIEIDPGADPLRLTALLDLIEELRTSGAEAMEIEGADGEAVRLVASSSLEVSQPAPGLNVGGELISPPYRLQVIGPPDTLAGAIDFYQGPQDQLEEQGAEVEVESEEKIDIESIHTVSR